MHRKPGARNAAASPGRGHGAAGFCDTRHERADRRWRVGASTEHAGTGAAAALRDHRLDLLKAVAVVAVCFWHFQQGRVASPPSVPDPASLLQLYNHQVSLAAVPVFVLTSLCLFAKRASLPRLGRRLLRIGGPLAFWMAVQVALYRALSGAWPEWSLGLLRTGGPKLPVPAAGASVFYYLVVILFLLVLGWLFSLLPRTARTVVGAVVVAVSLGWFESMNLRGLQIQYFDFLNFVVYVPLAWWIGSAEESFKHWRWAFAGLWLAAAAQDVWLLTAQPRVSLYGRPVVVLGACAIVAFVLSADVREHPLVTFLSRHTLGIYATHKYWYALFTVLAARIGLSTAGTTLLDPAWIAVVALAFAATLGTTALAARTPLRPLVS